MFFICVANYINIYQMCMRKLTHWGQVTHILCASVYVFGAKPLSETTSAYCSQGDWFRTFQWYMHQNATRKWMWKCRWQNGGQFWYCNILLVFSFCDTYKYHGAHMQFEITKLYSPVYIIEYLQIEMLAQHLPDTIIQEHVSWDEEILLEHPWIDQSHKSKRHLSHIPQFTIQNRNFCSEWCSVGCGIGAWWDSCICSVVPLSLYGNHVYSPC